MKRYKDTRAIIRECHSEGRVLLTQTERDHIGCAYASSFGEEVATSGNLKNRDEIEEKLASVMSALDSDLIVSVDWLKQIINEINERSRSH